MDDPIDYARIQRYWGLNEADADLLDQTGRFANVSQLSGIAYETCPIHRILYRWCRREHPLV